MSQFPVEDALKPECDSLRADLLVIEKRTRALLACDAHGTWLLASNESELQNKQERIQQLTLSVRHIEDARMRIGKVLQYSRDGVSAYDTGLAKERGLVP